MWSPRLLAFASILNHAKPFTNPRTFRRASSLFASDTGGLRKLPVLKRSEELTARARKAAHKIRPDSTMKNGRDRARKEGAEKMNALSQALCLPLRDLVRGYRRELGRLHPFERVVADLATSARKQKDGLTLDDVLSDIAESRKELLLAGKDWTARAKGAQTAREAGEAIDEGTERMCELFEELAGRSVDDMVDLQKSLRNVPAVRLDSPAVVLVGSPNVGKSSIVRAISSGTPEVNNYPFTTRGMTLGHVEALWEGEQEEQLCQVMDSPGLLVRPDNERNNMEALTLAAMRHLPTAVMYIMDFSGAAGDRCSSISDQLILRKEVRARFPRRPWIDVVSKVDLGIVEGAREDLEEILDGDHYLELSIKDNIGVEELQKQTMRMLGEVRLVLDAMAAVDPRTARPVAK